MLLAALILSFSCNDYEATLLSLYILYRLGLGLRLVHGLVNPRRACAARVTVVVLCIEGYSSCPVHLSVSLSVCLSPTILALQATRRLMSHTNSISATRA